LHSSTYELICQTIINYLFQFIKIVKKKRDDGSII